MPIPLRRARTFATALTLVLLTALGTRQAHAVDAVSKGYEETISQNTHGLGISFGVGGLNGIAYRHYFGNLALQVDLFPLIADSGNYVAVFGGVTFIDSTALGVLIGGVRRVNAAGGAMALVVTSRPVERVLSITGLDRVFTIHESLEDAIAALA